MIAGVAAVAVLVAAGGVWRLWQQDYFWQNPLADATVERLTDFEGEEVDAAISPDGKFMAFLSDRDGPFDAWISQIGSGEFVNITKGRFQLMNNPNTRSAGFSGDGAQVWFMQQVSARPLRWTSWIAPALGGAPRTFVEGGLDPIWSPDGKNVVYHTNDLGDPIFIADRNGSNPRQIFVAPPGVHGHYLTWSPDGRFIYFVRGILPTEEMDIWRIPVSPSEAAAAPERITSHNARVAYPAWLDARTLIYSATAEDGSGQWLYAIDVEHRIPHRVSSGIAEQYLSVACQSSPTAACGHHHRHSHRQPVDGPHLGSRSDGGGGDAGAGSEHACPWPSLRSRLPGLPVLQRRRGRTVEAGKRRAPGTLARRRWRRGGSSGHLT